MVVGDFKIVVRDDVGDFDQYGTDDVEIVMRLLKGVLSGTQPPLVMIKSEQGWEWYPETSPLWIRDSDASHKYNIKTGNLSADFDLTIPPISTDSSFAIDSIVNTFLEAQEFEDVIKIAPRSLPSTDAAFGQIVPDIADSNKLKYIKPDGTVIDLTAAAGAGAPTTATYVTLSLHATLSNERTLAAGDGHQLIDGGANGSVTFDTDVIDLARKRVTLIEDFLNVPGSGGAFQKDVSGTGADVTTIAVTDSGVFGVWQLDTGTTSSGVAGVRAGNLNSIALGQGVTIWECKVKLPTLSTAGEEYIVRIGLGDSDSGAPTDSCLFKYNRTATVNWQIQAKSNTAETLVNTTTPVTTGWVRLKVVVNAAGTSASFFVNGTEVSGSPLTTNIPTTTARQLTPITSIDKDAGSSNRLIWLDYVALDIKLTSPR